MFTGIIETIGTLVNIVEEGTNKKLYIESSLSQSLDIDESVSHNGVCLTVVDKEGNIHVVDVIEESLKKSNLNLVQVGDPINLERALVFGGRLDGHLVQGHVDGTAVIIDIQKKDGSTEYLFSIEDKFAPQIIEKGSICINGVSLTCFEVTRKTFKVAIIPYTYNHTTFHQLSKGNIVNVEFDLVGKYILRHQILNQP